MEKTSNGFAKKFLADGEFEVIRLTEEYYEEATEIYMTCFIKYENVCIATNLMANKVAVAEIETLFREVLKDKTSFGARHIASNRLAAICVNKILEPKSHCNLDKIFEHFQSPEMLFIGGYLDQMENTYDLYKNLNIDCCMEVLFLSTRPEFEKKGLATALTVYSMDFAKDLQRGLIADELFPEHIQGKRPEAVSSIFTSRFTQMIGQKLGFQEVHTVPYTEIIYNGHSFASKLNPIHVNSVFACKRI